MGSLSKAEVEDKLALLIGDDITSKLRSSNWKERLEAMGELQQRVQDMKENLDAPLLIQVCIHHTIAPLPRIVNVACMLQLSSTNCSAVQCSAVQCSAVQCSACSSVCLCLQPAENMRCWLCRDSLICPGGARRIFRSLARPLRSSSRSRKRSLTSARGTPLWL